MNGAAWAALAALALALSLQKIASYDYWWHLRTGRLIAETGAVPRVDPFTFTVPGARWIDIHWLFQRGLYAVHELGGHDLFVLVKGALILSLVPLLATIGSRRNRPFVMLATLGLVLLIVSPRIIDRPELLSFVLLAASLALFHRFERNGDVWIYAVVPLQLVWANVHGLFAVGVAVCAIALAGELGRPLGPERAALRPARLRRLAAVTVLACLASVVNPNTLDAALYPLQQFGMIGLPGQRSGGPQSTELQSLVNGWRLMSVPYLALLVALAVFSGAGMLLNGRRLRSGDALLWVAFAVLALAAVRNVPLFAIVAGTLAVRNWNEFLDRFPPRPGVTFAATALCAATLAILAADAARGSFFPRIGVFREPGVGVAEWIFPVGAAEWIAREKPEGPLCHHMIHGGYLIWRLHPDYPVMADGRLEVFGGDTTRALRLNSAKQFHSLDGRYRCGMVLVQFAYDYPQGLVGELFRSPRWALRYVDDVGALFAREPGGGIDVDAEGLFPVLDGEPGPSDFQRLLVRHRFYGEIGSEREVRRIRNEVQRRYPDRIR